MNTCISWWHLYNRMIVSSSPPHPQSHENIILLLVYMINHYYNVLFDSSIVHEGPNHFMRSWWQLMDKPFLKHFVGIELLLYELTTYHHASYQWGIPLRDPRNTSTTKGMNACMNHDDLHWRARNNSALISNDFASVHCVCTFLLPPPSPLFFPEHIYLYNFPLVFRRQSRAIQAKMEFTVLARFDDFLSASLLDGLFLWFKTIKMNEESARPSTPAHAVLKIIRKHIVEEESMNNAVQELLK